MKNLFKKDCDDAIAYLGFMAILLVVLVVPTIIIQPHIENRKEITQEFKLVTTEKLDNGKVYLIIEDNNGKTRDISVSVATYVKYKDKEKGTKIYFKMSNDEYNNTKSIPTWITVWFCISLFGGICLISLIFIGFSELSWRLQIPILCAIIIISVEYLKTFPYWSV